MKVKHDKKTVLTGTVSLR